MTQDDHADDGDVPPPPPPKPANFRPQASKNSNSSISLYAVLVVGLAAISVSSFAFVLTNDPLSPTIIDTLSNLHYKYVSAPSIESIADLVEVGHTPGKELSTDQSSRLSLFRDRWNAAQQTPDWSNVTHASISLPRKPFKYYRAEGTTTKEHADAKQEFEERLASGKITPRTGNFSATLIAPKPDSVIHMLINEKNDKVRKLPTLVFLHDGMFVAGSANHSWAAELARSIPCMVVAVEYSLAPENLYHDAVIDAVDAMMWSMGVTEDFFTDIDRFGFVGIEAGATIATAAALHMRDRGFRHSIRVLGLAVPLLTRPSAKFESYLDSESTWKAHSTAWDLYTGHTTAEEKKRCRFETVCSPFHARNMTKIPPVLMYTASTDPARDAALSFADGVYKQNEFVRTTTAVATPHGTIRRLDEGDIGWIDFVGGLQEAFWPTVSEAEQTLNHIRKVYFGEDFD